MKVIVVVVGKGRGPLAESIRDYEQRVRHYFPFEVVEVKEERATGSRTPEQVMEAEAERLLARVPAGFSRVALHRGGSAWSSDRLAAYLQELGLRAHPGMALMVGGAFGLAQSLLDGADHLLSLSAMTLPHEMARLVITEQLYRAGTILRGEPYHKATHF